MKIAFDSWALSSRFRHTGIYTYAQNLLAQFSRMDSGEEVDFSVFACSGIENDANLLERGPVVRPCHASLLRSNMLWRLGGASLAAARSGADMLFAPVALTMPTGMIPIVCTIHDIAAVTQPSQPEMVTLLQRAFLWPLVKFSRTIITVSEFSQRDIVNVYGVPEARVAVVYQGYDKLIFNDIPADPEMQTKLRERLGIQRPYILHHGVIQPRKNLKRLIEAYRLMLSRNHGFDFDMVMAGPLGWKYDEILATAANSAGTKGRVVLTGALSDTDLALLIKGATLAVIPSLYEGFCLPMVEAMACGCPTIAAGASCLPEVSGGVLRYFDPLSVEDMADCMAKTLEDTGMRAELSQKGKRQAGVYTWERCAKETLEVLRRSVEC
ncbi:MAG TPA: glycosyltransferase family 1 protein [Candidatus Angelobacter sp.]|nr:glycosyltransferase family 1 protein [Candidatus Angelobacter sp.]